MVVDEKRDNSMQPVLVYGGGRRNAFSTNTGCINS